MFFYAIIINDFNRSEDAYGKRKIITFKRDRFKRNF